MSGEAARSRGRKHTGRVCRCSGPGDEALPHGGHEGPLHGEHRHCHRCFICCGASVVVGSMRRGRMLLC